MPSEESVYETSHVPETDLPEEWVETETSARGQTFTHTVTGAEATVYDDQGWTVTLAADGEIPDFETRHSEFCEAAETLLNAMGLYNQLADTTRNLCSK